MTEKEDIRAVGAVRSKYDTVCSWRNVVARCGFVDFAIGHDGELFKSCDFRNPTQICHSFFTSYQGPSPLHHSVMCSDSSLVKILVMKDRDYIRVATYS